MTHLDAKCIEMGFFYLAVKSREMVLSMCWLADRVLKIGPVNPSFELRY